MYKIKAPTEEYDRKIGGVQFVNGEAQTNNQWLASWFSGRPGFTVTEEAPAEKLKERRRNDKGSPDEADRKSAAESAAGNA